MMWIDTLENGKKKKQNKKTKHKKLNQDLQILEIWYSYSCIPKLLLIKY